LVSIAEKKKPRPCDDLARVNNPVKMSRFDHAVSQEMTTMSAAVSASDPAIITKAIVSAA
jgi:hypothetical protein